MADGNEDNRGRKDNTSRDHRPKTARDNQKAPRGHLGTNRLGSPSPGQGSSIRPQQSSKAISQTNEDREKKPSRDTRPLATKTNDPAVNQEYRRQGYRLVTDQELQRMKQAGPDQDRRSSDARKPPKDYNAIGRNRAAKEFNARSQSKQHSGPNQPNKGRSR